MKAFAANNIKNTDNLKLAFRRAENNEGKA